MVEDDDVVGHGVLRGVGVKHLISQCGLIAYDAAFHRGPTDSTVVDCFRNEGLCLG